MSSKIKNAKAKEKIAYLREQVHEKGRKISESVGDIKYDGFLDMKDDEVDETLTFHGKKCCRFKRLAQGENEKTVSRSFEMIANFGEGLYFDDGEMISDLASDFEGGSHLLRCPECGALFLHITGKNCIAFWDDDYYTYKHDYYQVESLEHAMKLNLLEGGHLKAYDGSHFGTYEVC